MRASRCSSLPWRGETAIGGSPPAALAAQRPARARRRGSISMPCRRTSSTARSSSSSLIGTLRGLPCALISASGTARPAERLTRRDPPARLHRVARRRRRAARSPRRCGRCRRPSSARPQKRAGPVGAAGCARRRSSGSWTTSRISAPEPEERLARRARRRRLLADPAQIEPRRLQRRDAAVEARRDRDHVVDRDARRWGARSAGAAHGAPERARRQAVEVRAGDARAATSRTIPRPCARAARAARPPADERAVAVELEAERRPALGLVRDRDLVDRRRRLDPPRSAAGGRAPRRRTRSGVNDTDAAQRALAGWRSSRSAA